MARKTGPSSEQTQGAGRYGAMRDFARTPEPSGEGSAAAREGAPVFVVQKHDASRLHWDFRLEHGGVLWSWAVPKGPSLDPGHKRLAMHVEDHPLEYAGFEGTIPEGNYGAGTVEIWDRGTWSPAEIHAADPAAALAKGELKIRLDGSRLKGGFVLVRLKPRPREKSESWLLIKEHDQYERADADAGVLEAVPLGATKKRAAVKRRARQGKDALQDEQAPQLARLVRHPPSGPGWISEVKFDGYRMLCRKEGDAVRIITRNGLDWTQRMPGLAAAVGGLAGERLMLDGELVALDKKGLSSFARLQEAFSTGKTDALVYYAFDLLHQDGVDLRERPLKARRAALEELLEAVAADATVRFSEHLESEANRVKHEACAIGLEGIVCKRVDAPYRPGRGDDWVKVKCENREEFVVLGYTPPGGTRRGLGALQLGFHDSDGVLHFVGGCGTGFSGKALSMLSDRLAALRAEAPERLLGTEKPPRETVWVRPELVVELKYAGFSGGGMLRHASFQGLREDKPATEVVRAVPDAEARRIELGSRREAGKSSIVVAKKSERGAEEIGGQRISHADRTLWQEDATGDAISKRDLALYWQAMAEVAAPGILGRPLALVRCPDGIGGEQFFQKHLGRGMPDGLREGEADGAPYVAIDAPGGLIAAAQVAAVELHTWGASGEDPLHADRLVFDLDPGEGVAMGQIVAAAKEVKARLEALGLAAFCRTSGGKGLHVLAPVRTDQGWDAVRAWCRRFAEAMEADAPELYLSTTRKKDREGRILVDWLRNGLGSTAIASFSPRARPGAGVATPLAWREVTGRLDLSAFTVRSVPGRVARQKADPWVGFAEAAVELPVLPKSGGKDRKVVKHG